jgi:hypothetical protein
MEAADHILVLPGHERPVLVRHAELTSNVPRPPSILGVRIAEGEGREVDSKVA